MFSLNAAQLEWTAYVIWPDYFKNYNIFLIWQDNEGQTPLHYAVVCDRETISELLVKHGANPQITDNDGNSPVDLCDSKWPFMITE